MSDCYTCKYAEWDYDTFFGTPQKQWFVSGCKKDQDAEDCEKYEEEWNEPR